MGIYLSVSDSVSLLPLSSLPFFPPSQHLPGLNSILLSLEPVSPRGPVMPQMDSSRQVHGHEE